MISEKTGYPAKALAVWMVILALWATTAIAGMNEDFFNAAGKGDLSVLKRLIAKGAEVNAKGADGVTALILASQNGHKEAVQALLDKGAEVNAKRTDGGTALILAFQNCPPRGRASPAGQGGRGQCQEA